MHKFNYKGDFNSSDDYLLKYSKGFGSFSPGDLKGRSLNLRVIKEEQDTDKLEILRQLLVSVNLENNAEKLKANNEYYSEGLENSRLKNQVLALESEILEIKSLKNTGNTPKTHKFQNKPPYQDPFPQVTRSISLKNLGHNLEYLEERLKTLQTKTHKSHLKLTFHKNKYLNHQIPDLKKSLSSVHSRIETLESESFHLTSSLKTLQSQNLSISKHLSALKPKLNSLRSKNLQLFRALSILQSKLIKKPISFPI